MVYRAQCLAAALLGQRRQTLLLLVLRAVLLCRGRAGCWFTVSLLRNDSFSINLCSNFGLFAIPHGLAIGPLTVHYGRVCAETWVYGSALSSVL